MIKAIRHTGLVVQDIERALDFWCNVLGFHVEKKQEESGSYIDALLGMSGVLLTTAKLSAPDGNLVELLCFHSHPESPLWPGKPNSTGFTHLAMTVDNVDILCDKLSTSGVAFFSRPQCSPDGYAKVVFAICPEGTLLEFVEVQNK